jgi:hypothetical protein
MSQWMILPNGDAVTSSVIKSVSLHKAGVVCRDAQQKVVSWIPTQNQAVGGIVRDKLIAFARDGNAPQPNWIEIFATNDAEDN